MSSLKKQLDSFVASGKITDAIANNLMRFKESYVDAVEKNGYPKESAENLIERLAHHTVKQIEHPYRFESYHKRILKPFNYYEFGLDFIRPLMDLKHSSVQGIDHLNQIVAQLQLGENVVLFANHQTEPDPQIISILLENTHPLLAEEMIFVAGHRVVTDPLAVPFSKGRNLLCIYSKKHIEHPPELKAEKLLHNQKTLKKMGELLNKGGKCIYVAPSGGRDRMNSEGVIEIAKFDPQSIDLFLLMAQRAKKKTHFYPLAMATYHLLPPPNSIEKEIGEKRHANSIPVHLYFGNEIHFDKISGDPTLSRLENRKKRAEAIWKLVEDGYNSLG